MKDRKLSDTQRRFLLVVDPPVVGSRRLVGDGNVPFDHLSQTVGRNARFDGNFASYGHGRQNHGSTSCPVLPLGTLSRCVCSLKMAQIAQLIFSLISNLCILCLVYKLENFLGF